MDMQSLQRRLMMRARDVIATIPLSLAIAASCAAWVLCSADAQSAELQKLGPDTGIAWNLMAKDIAGQCRSELTRAQSEIKSIEDKGLAQPFADGLGAIEALVANLQDVLTAHINLSQLAVAQDVRDASTECATAVSEFFVKLSADSSAYALVQSAAKSAVTPEERQLAKIYMENGQRAGAGLGPSQRAKMEQLFNQINKLQIDYGRALAEDKSEIALAADELKPLPESLNGSLKPSPQGALLPVNESTLTPFLQNETSGGARERYLVAYQRLGGRGNVTRLMKAVLLRKRVATIMGFPSWAAYQLDVKMARTPERAEGLILQLDQALLGKARDEVNVLSELKRAGGDNSPFRRWDYVFYEQLLQKTHYAVDEEQIRQYFPVDKVVPAMLDIYAHLFGVRFEEVQPANVWAPNTSEFAIYDAESNAAIGWFYLDLYPRFGKYNHFAAFPLRPGRMLADGSYRKPVAAIVGNWPAPAPGKPSLLSYSDLVTFFHEFGHIMHETLSRTRFASLYGPNTRGDFPEAPSQMLENWMLRPEVLKKISSNVINGEPLPDDLISRLIALKHVDDGVHWCRQVFFGMYDLRLHGPKPPTDITRLYFDLAAQLLPLKDIPGTYPEASFIHIMSGLDAGYYGYLWSLVYAQDMYSVFQHDGVDNPAVGKRYRDEILVPGGAAEPDVLIQRFLMRPVSLQPFYEELGITVH